MEINIEKQKEDFLKICRMAIKRDGIEELLAWLQKADFFTASASTRYHGAYKGGFVSIPSMCTITLCVWRSSAMKN